MGFLTMVREQSEYSGAYQREFIEETVRIRLNPVYHAVKRGMDIILALLLAAVMLLPMLIIAAVIKLESHGPALFTQKRMGQYGKIFIIYKFRTMRLDAPHDMATRDFDNLADYVTRFGAFLRRTSLDELPQLINILNGTMSFVGYRPVCLTEVELNGLRKAYGVFSVRPGLTGLAQVSGRDNIDAADKAEIDARYVKNCGTKMDLLCLIKTVKVVWSGEGAL